MQGPGRAFLSICQRSGETGYCLSHSRACADADHPKWAGGHHVLSTEPLLFTTRDQFPGSLLVIAPQGLRHTAVQRPARARAFWNRQVCSGKHQVCVCTGHTTQRKDTLVSSDSGSWIAPPRPKPHCTNKETEKMEPRIQMTLLYSGRGRTVSGSQIQCLAFSSCHKNRPLCLETLL